MNLRHHKIATHLPHRLAEYRHSHCFCFKDNRSLGIVRGIKVMRHSYLKNSIHYFVSYVARGVSMAQIYKDGEIELLEIIDDRVELTEISANLTKMEAEIHQAEHWYSDGDSYLDFIKGEYFSFAKDVPAILRLQGYRPAR